MADAALEYISTMRTTLTDLFDRVAKLYDEHGTDPLPGSPAAVEFVRCDRQESMTSVWSIAAILIDSAGEHVQAFVQTSTEPVLPIACWTCVRSMLESSALACWLLDPTIDATKRVSRCFALRYEGLEQELKYGQAANQPATELEKLKRHIDNVESDALRLRGYRPLRSTSGKRTGICEPMPGATTVIRDMLNEESTYRLLSAVTHGHFWAISRLSYIAVSNENADYGDIRRTAMTKTGFAKGFAFLGMKAARIFSKAVWHKWQYFGWDMPSLVSLLEETFDKLQAKQEIRFWRPPTHSA